MDNAVPKEIQDKLEFLKNLEELVHYSHSLTHDDKATSIPVEVDDAVTTVLNSLFNTIKESTKLKDSVNRANTLAFKRSQSSDTPLVLKPSIQTTTLINAAYEKLLSYKQF